MMNTMSRLATASVLACMVLVGANAAAHAAESPSKASGTANNKYFYTKGNKYGAAGWADYAEPTSGKNIDTDAIWIYDNKKDGHGVFVEVNHPRGRQADVNNAGAGNGTLLPLPNLSKGQELELKVCLSEKNTPISSTCNTYTITE